MTFGPKEQDVTPGEGITRKFTKALDFRGGQSVKTTWANDSSTSRKPDTIEFRFRLASGSNQTLVQAGTDWAIIAEDNGSPDDYGNLKFIMGGLTVSTAQTPIYDGEFHSVMLTRLDEWTVFSYIRYGSFGNSDISLRRK